MGFNVDKCNSLTLSLKRKLIEKTYILNNQHLERVNSSKYMEITISKNLNWKVHINNIAAKANKTSTFVHRNTKHCPTKVQTQCYKSLVHPSLEYACAIWSLHQKEDIKGLEVVQRRAARRICKDFSQDTSATALVSSLGLETLKCRRDHCRAIMMYKVINGLVDVQPKEGTIVPNQRSSQRQSAWFQIPFARTNVRLYSFFPMAIRMWNSLPAAAINTPSLDAFKMAVKDWKFDYC